MRVGQFQSESGSVLQAMRPSGNSWLFRCLVGSSVGIRKVRDDIEHAAALWAPVLLRGETGTGKEVVARNIHYLSCRRRRPFVAMDCSATEFEQAGGGTVFFDEVADIEPRLQRRLDRVLQQQAEELSGDAFGIERRARLIAATHRDLRAMTAEGRFSKPLYDHLIAVQISLPPLRERREDLPLLISEINARLAGRGYRACRVNDAALRAMLAYDWPGNVRELARLLKNSAMRAARMEIRLEDLPKRIRGMTATADREVVNTGWRTRPELHAGQLRSEKIGCTGLLDFLEERLIRRALAESGGAIPLAANRLGLREASLIAGIKQSGIDQAQEAPSPD